MLQFYKKILLEIVLFATMVTLAGHVTVNIWERYFVQNKLSDIKNSLDHLKITVHNMEYAYDDLQKSLIDIAKRNVKLPNSVYSSLIKQPIEKKNGFHDGLLDHLNILAKVNDKARVLIDKNPGSNKNAKVVTRLPIITETAARMITVTGINPASVVNRSNGMCTNNCRTTNSVKTCTEDCRSNNITHQKF